MFSFKRNNKESGKKDNKESGLKLSVNNPPPEKIPGLFFRQYIKKNEEVTVGTTSINSNVRDFGNRS